MALTPEDIELHKRLIRSYEVQYESAERRWAAAADEMRFLGTAIAADEMRFLGTAIAAEKLLLAVEEETTAQRGCRG